LFSSLSEILNSKIQLTYTKERLGDIKHSLADISSAQKAFNYKPFVNFKTGLEKSLDWYKTHL
jgi:nucleoside-diphosphate-sugar epimerase